MAEGRVVRFEEITRCPLEVQDCLLVAAVRPGAGDPGADGADAHGLRARRVQRHRHGQHPRPRRQRDERRAQAAVQLRDRLPDRRLRHRAGAGRAPRPARCCAAPGVTVAAAPRRARGAGHHVPRAARPGRPTAGDAMERLTAVMSTAEAVSVAHAVGLRGWFLRGERRHRRRPRGVPGRHRGQGQPRGSGPAAPLPRTAGRLARRRAVAGAARRPTPAARLSRGGHVHRGPPPQPGLRPAGRATRSHRLRPAYVLVEGPADMNARLDELLLGHELPVAVFSSYRDGDAAARLVGAVLRRTRPSGWR